MNKLILIALALVACRGVAKPPQPLRDRFREGCALSLDQLDGALGTDVLAYVVLTEFTRGRETAVVATRQENGSVAWERLTTNSVGGRCFAREVLRAAPAPELQRLHEMHVVGKGATTLDAAFSLFVCTKPSEAADAKCSRSFDTYDDDERDRRAVAVALRVLDAAGDTELKALLGGSSPKAVEPHK
jgi:hypothetical protein